MNWLGIFKLGFNLWILKREPFSLIHFVTNKCNARCEHCFIDFGDPHIFNDELTLKEIEKITKSLGGHLFNVNLTGGEPFLRKDLFEIASLYFKNTPVESVFISTNGMFTSATKRFVDRFIYEKIKGKVIFSISIDDFEKEHDAHRKVKGLFDNAIKTYKVLQAYRRSDITANIGITVTGRNYHNVVRLYEHLKRRGVKSITATIMREEGTIKRIDPETKKKILQAYIKLTDLIRRDQINGKMIGFDSHLQGLLMNSKNMIINKIIRGTYVSPKFISSCPAGSLFGVLYANGDVYPCEILNTKLGNLRDYGLSFKKLWRGQEAKNCRRFIENSRCNCTFECALTVNIISSPKFIPSLLFNVARVKRWKKNE